MMQTADTQPSLMLVEDSEDDAFFFHRTLQKVNSSVSLCHFLNGSLAVEFLKNAFTIGKLPVLVFLDLKMPLMNGFDVLSWIKKQPFASTLPVLVLSGSEHQTDKQRALQLGAREHIVKPLTNEKLLECLTKYGVELPAAGKTEGSH